ncbi:MAG: LysR family transcriptional regulator [candidate division Zixibacteria bacterium]|nr:LysR family transcriptional regulator [candidate division Zixibacteria bacterium]
MGERNNRILEEKMELQTLRGFYWAGVHGSFSKAGKTLNIGQSAISHQVKSLEEELHVKLYQREGRGISLTPEGKILVAYVDIILQTLDNIETHFADLSDSSEGTVNLAAYRGIMQYKLPAIVQNFKRKNPEIRLVILQKTLDSEVLDMVSSGHIDFGITSSWNDFTDISFFEVWTYDMFLCVPGNHRLAGRRKVALKEIVREPLILYERENSIHKRIERIFKENNLSYNIVIETGGATVIQEYVKVEQGISIVSGLVTQAKEDQLLSYIPVTEHFGKLGYGIAIKKRKYLSLPVRKFLQEIGLGEALASQNWKI